MRFAHNGREERIVGAKSSRGRWDQAFLRATSECISEHSRTRLSIRIEKRNKKVASERRYGIYRNLNALITRRITIRSIHVNRKQRFRSCDYCLPFSLSLFLFIFLFLFSSRSRVRSLSRPVCERVFAQNIVSRFCFPRCSRARYTYCIRW